jgi:hypothetical protein
MAAPGRHLHKLRDRDIHRARGSSMHCRETEQQIDRTTTKQTAGVGQSEDAQGPADQQHQGHDDESYRQQTACDSPRA